MVIFKDGKRPPAKTLYKYLKPEHVEGAVTEGRFRIGTLHEYRNAEKYPGAQLDRGEGDVMLDGSVGSYSSKDGHAPPPVIDAMFPGIGSAKNVTIEGAIFQDIHQESPNFYIFCAAHRFNLDIYNRAEYGAAVLITDEYAFCRAVSFQLIRDGYIPKTGVLSADVEYKVRRNSFMYDKGRTDWDNDTPPFFVKPEAYAEEYESRLVWEILSFQEDLIINCPEAAKFCEAYRPNTDRTASDDERQPDPHDSHHGSQRGL